MDWIKVDEEIFDHVAKRINGEGVGWRQSRQPTPSPKLKPLNVISNEVRNLNHD
jgi:hypothetical protein